MSFRLKICNIFKHVTNHTKNNSKLSKLCLSRSGPGMMRVLSTCNEGFFPIPQAASELALLPKFILVSRVCLINEWEDSSDLLEGRRLAVIGLGKSAGSVAAWGISHFMELSIDVQDDANTIGLLNWLNNAAQRY